MEGNSKMQSPEAGVSVVECDGGGSWQWRLWEDLRRGPWQGLPCAGLAGCHCYAQVAKSPNDHQGADIPCKSKRVFITKLELGLPPTDAAAIGRSPELWVALLI